MIKLSVNVNKVATLRNSRGGSVPSVERAVTTCLDAGAPGITVHPRADERHIRPDDVHGIARLLAARRAAGAPAVEFNIEGDPRPALIDLVLEVKPDQCTLVPVQAGEITSQAGWPPDTRPATLRPVVAALQDVGVRVSLFVDPDDRAIEWAAGCEADRVELYTEPFARAFERGGPAARESFEVYAAAAEAAHRLGLGVNAGHDLDLQNLTLFRRLPHLDEVSIGHALVGDALWMGLAASVRAYLDVLVAGEGSPAV
ncbi:MAG TPA: pyridoxine 5'-phosphate synthase [Vicinamibacterales bacterium]|nr:pyridoxine 5'-phosphate synthase [Vicinamibacterales bacterium]